jgi:hypothetical protein
VRARLTYRDEWTEEVEVDVPEGAAFEEAEQLLAKAAERHRPSPPPAKRITPCNLIHEGWADDVVWPLRRTP